MIIILGGHLSLFLSLQIKMTRQCLAMVKQIVDIVGNWQFDLDGSVLCWTLKVVFVDIVSLLFSVAQQCLVDWNNP